MVVELTMQPGASVARIVRDHGVDANQVFTWLRCTRRDSWLLVCQRPLANSCRSWWRPPPIKPQ